MKSVNDTLGHGAGDALLQAISISLLKQVRKNDLVARIGGDEFAILLDNIKPDALAKKTLAIIDSVANISADFEGHILKPRISAGFTDLEPGVLPANLMQRADRSMYAAKKAKSPELSESQASAR
jgi:diguanylate cyclase (GGDEF)-like protein